MWVAGGARPRLRLNQTDNRGLGVGVISTDWLLVEVEAWETGLGGRLFRVASLWALATDCQGGFTGMMECDSEGVGFFFFLSRVGAMLVAYWLVKVS